MCNNIIVFLLVLYTTGYYCNVNFPGVGWIKFILSLSFHGFIMFSTATKLFSRTPLGVLVVSFAAKQKLDCRRSGGQGWVLYCTEKLTWGKTWVQVVSATKSIAPPQECLMNSDRFHLQGRHPVPRPNSCLPVFFSVGFLFFILVLVLCLCICRSLLFLIVTVTLIGRNNLSRWSLHPSREMDVTVWPSPLWWPWRLHCVV